MRIFKFTIFFLGVWSPLYGQYSQAPFNSPGTLPAQVHPLVLYTTQAEIDSLRQRCIGALSRAPYTTWYNSLVSDANSFRDTDGPETGDEYEHGLGMMRMALAWIISETQSYLDSLTASGWMDTSPTFNAFKSDGEVYKLIAYDIIADSITAGQRTSMYNAIKARVDLHDADSRVTNSKAINGALHMLAGLLLQDHNASWAQSRLEEGIANIDSTLTEQVRGGIWSEGAGYGNWVAVQVFYAYTTYLNSMSVDFWDDDRFRDFFYWIGTISEGRRTGFNWTYDDQHPYHANHHGIWPALINSSITQEDTAKIIRGYHSHALDNVAGTNFAFKGAIAGNLAYFRDTEADAALTPDTTSIHASIYNERAGQLYFADRHNGHGIEGLYTFETWHNHSESSHEHNKGLSFEIWRSSAGDTDSSLVTISQPGYGVSDLNNWFKNWNDHNVITHTTWNDNSNRNDDAPILGGATEKFSVAIGHYDDTVNNVDWRRMILHVRDEDIVLFADWMEDLGGTNRNWSSRMKVRYGTPGKGEAGTYSSGGGAQWAEYDTAGVEVRIHFLLPDGNSVSEEQTAIEYRNSGYYWPASNIVFSGNGWNTKSQLLTAGGIQVQPTTDAYYTYVESSNGGVLDDGDIEYNIVAQWNSNGKSENNMVTNAKYTVVADSSNTVMWFFNYDGATLSWNGSNVWNANANIDGMMISVDVGASGKWEGVIKENNPIYYVRFYTPSQPDSVMINDVKHTDWAWETDNAKVNISESGTYTICLDYGAGDCGTAAVTEVPPGGETAPTAPTALSFTSITQTSFNVQWQDNSDNEDGFKVYWDSTSTKPASHNGAVGQNITTFTIQGLNCGTNYFVWVEAYNNVGSADNSDQRQTDACTDPPAGTPDSGPSYPRISALTFYGIDGTDIWDYHDLVGLRYYHIASATNLRTSNSDVVILALNDEIRGGDEGTIRTKFGNNKYPKIWRVKTTGDEYLQFTPNAYLMNPTSTCPDTLTEFGSMNFSEYLARALIAYSDTTLFDGTWFDWWASSMTNTWSKHATVDLNVNGVADATEGGVDAKWQQGNSYLIKQMQSVWKGTWATEPIIAHESETSIADSLNGWANENWRGRNWDTETASMSTHESANKTPKMPQLELSLTYTDGDQMDTGTPNASDYYVTPLKDQFQYVRYGLTTAGLLGLYFAVDEGANFHRFAGFIYDEFLADMGSPSGAYGSVTRNTRIKYRYFVNGSGDTTGVMLCNTAGDTSKVYSSDLKTVTTGSWYHFRGNQDPTVNDGSIFDSYIMQGAGGANNAAQTGDGLILLIGLDTLVAPVYIGNVDNNVTSPGSDPADFVGGWNIGMVSTTHHGVRIGWGGFGESYKYTTDISAATYVDFIPTINLAGTYEVWEWHNYANDETVGGNPIGTAGSTTYEIHHATGQKDTTINQALNSEQWNSLGTYTFTQGLNNKVRITTASQTGTVTVADAMRFVLQTVSAPSAAAVTRRRAIVN